MAALWCIICCVKTIHKQTQCIHYYSLFSWFLLTWLFWLWAASFKVKRCESEVLSLHWLPPWLTLRTYYCLFIAPLRVTRVWTRNIFHYTCLCSAAYLFSIMCPHLCPYTSLYICKRQLMDIWVNSRAIVDIMVHGRPQLPEGQNLTSPVTPTSYQETHFPLIRIW